MKSKLLSIITIMAAGIVATATSCKEEECAQGDPTCDLQAAAFFLNVLSNTGGQQDPFVAVGENGMVWYSTDGLSFTFGRTGSTANLNGIAYGNNTYVAVGDFGTILHSRDGLDWSSTEAGTPIENTNGNEYHYMDVVYGSDRFIAVGCAPDTATAPYDTCDTTGSPANVVRWSEDGIYWNTFKTPPSVAAPLTDIAYGNGLFVAIDDQAHGTATTNGFAYQLEADLWAPLAHTDPYEGITFGQDRFVLVGPSTSTPRYLDYTGGEPGTYKTASAGPGSNMLGVAYGSDKFVAVGAAGNASQSTAAENWNDEATGCTADLASVAIGNNRIIAVGLLTGPPDFSSACVNEDASGGSWSELLEGGAGMNRILFPSE